MAFDDDVGAGGEPVEGGVIGLDRDAALPRVKVFEEEAAPHAVGAGLERRQGTPGLAAGRLDLDDVGPEVGEYLAAERGGEGLAPFEHVDTVEE